MEPAQTARPLADVLERLASDGAAWRRQTAAGADTAIDSALREWLAGVDAAAVAWSAVEPGLAEREASADRPAPTGGSEVRLLRDGRLAAVVRLEAGAVVVETRLPGASPRTWRAALPADRASRLRAGLPASPR